MSVLDEQLRYYRARAREYDSWWERRGRYDLGEQGNARWWREVAEVRDALARAGLNGEVLEIAPGTGIWTELLAATAAQVTAVDASAEMIAVCRERLTRAGLVHRVTFVEADVLSWQPERRYDGVFFGHWLSHVPRERAGAFLATVARAMQPNGVLMFVDSRAPRNRGWALTVDEEHESRELLDGRRFRIVKRYETPAALERRFRAAGIPVRVHTTARHFVYGLTIAGVGRKSERGF